MLLFLLTIFTYIIIRLQDTPFIIIYTIVMANVMMIPVHDLHNYMQYNNIIINIVCRCKSSKLLYITLNLHKICNSEYNEESAKSSNLVL